MGKRWIERRLRKTAARLRSLRDELRVIDEQLAHLSDDADDSGIRALVSDSPEARVLHRESQAHAQAMAQHRAHLVAELAALERELDELLDAMTR